MNNQADLDNIIARVQKMLALSNSSEPHEAAAALRQAQKLMEKYNLDMGTVQLATIEEVVLKSKFSVSVPKPYEAQLMKVIAAAFGCNVLWRGAKSGWADNWARFIFIGEKTQLKVAEYTASVMVRKLISAKAEFSKGLPDYYDRKLKTKQIEGFCVGWVFEVTKTIRAFAGQQEALMLVNKYVEKNYPKAGTTKAQDREVGADGYYAGREVGAKESIQRPISSGPSQARIGSAA